MSNILDDITLENDYKGDDQWIKRFLAELEEYKKNPPKAKAKIDRDYVPFAQYVEPPLNPKPRNRQGILTMSDKVFAPFTPEQIKNLSNYQQNDRHHPFTCLDGNLLTPVESGWICSCCNYTQNWCHSFMAKPLETITKIRTSL